MKKIHKNKQKGFTLIETVIAMIIVLMVVTTFSSTTYTGMKANTSSKNRLQALEVTQNQIEDLRNSRDNNTWNTGARLLTYLEGTRPGYLQKQPLTKNESTDTIWYTGVDGTYGYPFTIYIKKSSLIPDTNSSSLIEMIIEVSPPNTTKVSVGTKLFAKP